MLEVQWCSPYDRVGHPKRPNRLGNIVNADDIRATGGGENRQSDRSLQTALRGFGIEEHSDC
jgi:hypothetical protein